MAVRLVPGTDLLPRARALMSDGHEVALLDSPPGTEAAHHSHLLVLGRARYDVAPDVAKQGEHLCLATFDWGVSRLGIRSRHKPALGFGLASYPVLARLTLDRSTHRIEEHGDTELLRGAERQSGTQAARVPVGAMRATHDQGSFAAMVRSAQRYIADGHSYQANLSLRLEAPFDADPADLFARVRQVNPSPYQALVSTRDVTLVSASPELLLRTEGRALATRPIAGTRRRGGTPDEDAQLERELVADAKERAEHAMLVDLARNDLGRVSTFGSVRVAESAVVERYSHVMHLVSEVEGELAPERTAWDAFEAVFPCGTISGAPKKRSVEIIDELEPVSRGAYTGSLGLVTPDRSVWNILIRTIVLHRGNAYVQAGAGIVADSVPEREYTECLHKARALVDALGGAV